LFKISAKDILISGIRLKGPDGEIVNREALDKYLRAQKAKGIKRDNSRVKTYGLPNSVGIYISKGSSSIVNCEISSWSHAAIRVGSGATASISYSYIHMNRREGLGYGVLVEGSASIKANIFDNNRHAIASSGIQASKYTAEYNICLENSSNQGHIFDVHGGKDRKDGTNLAGDKFIIRYNIFTYKSYPLFKIRGASSNTTQIYGNFIKYDGNSSISPNSNLFFQQININGNLEIKSNKFLK